MEASSGLSRHVPLVLLVLGLLVVSFLLTRSLLFEGADEGELLRSAAESAPPSYEARLEGRAPLENTTIHSAGTLRGTVLLDGAPQAARVRLWRVAGDPLPHADLLRDRWLLHYTLPQGEPDRALETTGDGRFHAEDLPAGTWHVEARVTGAHAGWTAIRLVEDVMRSVRLDLHAGLGGGALRGCIRYADGTPFEGYVLAQAAPPDPTEFGLLGPTMGAILLCDAEGRFETQPLSPGRVRLDAVLPGRLHLVRAAFVPSERDLAWVLGEGLRAVTGRVLVHGTEAPVVGATVEARAGEGHAVGTTDATGRFRVLTDWRWLAVRAKGLTSRHVTLAPGQTDVTVHLEPLAFLSGRVLEAGTERAVEGAVVHVVPFGWIRHDAKTTRSGPDGVWSVPGAASGPLSVFVLGGGWCSEGLGDLRDGAGDPFRVVMPPGERRACDLVVERSASLSGRVVEADGSLARGVRVTPLLPHSPPLAHLQIESVLSAEDGAYAFPDLLPGVEWRFELSRSSSHVPDPSRFLLRSGESIVEDLVLPPSRQVAVLVKDRATGRPLPSAYATSGGESILARADADGRVVLSYLPLEWHEEELPIIAAEGYVMAWFDPWRADRSEIHLEASEGLEGRIEGLPEGAAAESVRLVVLDPVWREVPVQPDGTFRDPSFPGEPANLLGRLKHDGRSYEGFALAAPGEKNVVLALRQEPEKKWWASVVWTIRVTGPDGIPVPRFQADVLRCGRKNCSGSVGYPQEEGTVEVRQDVHETGWVRIRTATDAAGASLGLAPQIVGPLGAEGGEVTVFLVPGTHLAGRVVDGRGRGLSGARLRITSEADVIPGMGSQPLEDRPVAVLWTEDDGSFRVEGLAVGRHTIRVAGSARHLAPPPLSVRSGASDVEIVLEETTVFDVRVEDPRGGPIASARVQAIQKASGRSAQASSDRRGRARLAGLDAAAPARLVVGAPYDRLDLRDLVVERWMPTDAAVRLQPGAGIRGLVFGPGGVPVPSVEVHLFTEDQRKHGYPQFADDDGRFRFRGLDPGATYGLAIETGDGKAPDAPTTLVEAGTTDVVLRADTGPAILVDVVGAPVLHGLPQLELLDLEANEAVAGATASKSGRAVFTNLEFEEGKEYAVLLHPGWTAPGLVGWRTGLVPRERPWVLRVERGHLLRARVANPEDLGDKPVNVRCDVGGSPIPGSIDDAGRILISGVPPGRWRVVLTRWNGSKVLGSVEVDVPGPEATLPIH